MTKQTARVKARQMGTCQMLRVSPPFGAWRDVNETIASAAALSAVLLRNGTHRARCWLAQALPVALARSRGAGYSQ